MVLPADPPPGSDPFRDLMVSYFATLNLQAEDALFPPVFPETENPLYLGDI